MTISARGNNFIVISRASPVAITMKQGEFKCLNRQQAMGALNEALCLGIPIDCKRNFKGEYRLFVSNVGVKALRLKHNWKPPAERKTNRHRSVTKKKRFFDDGEPVTISIPSTMQR
jgi:hypothetical protein